MTVTTPPNSSAAPTQTAAITQSHRSRHPIYWFDDGSLVLDVAEQSFRIHRSLVTRHSRYLAALAVDEEEDEGAVAAAQQPNGICVVVEERIDVNSESARRPRTRISVDPTRNVKPTDVDALLQHLYHDNPLAPDSPLAHLTSILLASSPSRLDFPALHARARALFAGLFPADPTAFTHDHPRHEALLHVATELGFASARKAILYSLVTMTDFTITSPSSSSTSTSTTTSTSPISSTSSSTSTSKYNLTAAEGKGEDEGEGKGEDEDKGEGEAEGALSPSLSLSLEVASLCTSLMNALIAHFTPLLFTPPAARHMACTDALAETWMALVIQPAIDGEAVAVYKPLETLQRMKEIDWAAHGLCASCVAEKRAEWAGEQRLVWARMDGWLSLSMGHDTSSS